MENHEHHEPCANCQSGHNHGAAPQPISDLDALKNEITAKLENKNAKNSLPWGSLTVTVALGILALVSIAQMAQTTYIYNKIKSGELKTTNAPAAGALDSQPEMVGGC